MNPALLEKLKHVDHDSIIGYSIKNALQKGKLKDLEKMLREAYQDNPYSMKMILGFDLNKYIQ